MHYFSYIYVIYNDKIFVSIIILYIYLFHIKLLKIVIFFMHCSTVYQVINATLKDCDFPN